MKPHRNRPYPAAAPVAAVLFISTLFAAAPPAHATISSIDGGCRVSPGGPIAIRAGRQTRITVKGTGVDLVQSVADTGLGGVRVEIGDRTHGLGSSVELRITVDAGIRHGDEGRIRLRYPVGEDSFPVKLVAEATIRGMSVEGVTPDDRHRNVLDLNRDYTLVLRGSNLTLLSPPSRVGIVSVSVVSRSADEARLQIRSGTDRFQHIDPRDLEKTGCGEVNVTGEAGINLLFGTPRPTPTRTPAPPAATPTARQVTPTATPAPRTTNLLPVMLFPERPLLRKINTLSSIMVPIALCGTLGNDEEGDKPLPAFEWGVSNTNDADVATPFDIQLVDGASGRTLATERLTQLPRGQFRTFSNWPGRPATIRVVRVVARLLRDYDNSPGCYLAKPGASSVPLDPRPILIRVDTGNTVPEGNRENDNELSRN